MEHFLQLLVSGTMLGLVYALVALGWVLIYKCSGVLNLAVGELTMLGGFVSLALYTYFVQNMPVHMAFIFALAGTIFVGLVLGLLTQRIVFGRMIGGVPIPMLIMATVGLSLFFKGMVFIIWDPSKHFFDPGVFSGEPFTVAGLSVGQAEAWSLVAALILMAVIVCFLKFSRSGLSMRACAEGETAALSLGISLKLVGAVAWAIAFMAAGVGGTLLGIINGLDYSVSLLGLLVLPIVVIGGLDSVPGAIVGGIIIGISQSLASGCLGEYFPAAIKEIAPFVVMYVFLLVRPYGLWGTQRIERA